MDQLRPRENPPATPSPRTMFMLHRRLDVIDRRVRHPAALENSQPFGGGFGASHRLDQTLDDVAVLHPFTVGHEARVGGPFGVAQPGAENREEAVIPATEEDIPIQRLESGIWHNGSYITSDMSRSVWVHMHKTGAYGARCPIAQSQAAR